MIDASLSEAGALIVAHKGEGYRSQITVYDTALKENNFKLDLERVEHWLSKGAKPSETVASLIRRAKNPALKPHHAVKAKDPAKKEAAPAA